MISVTTATKTAFKADSIAKTIIINFPDLAITFTNTDIVGDSLKLTERLETEKTLNFIGCNASQFSVSIIDTTTDLRGQHVVVTATATDAETITLFDGYVDSQTNQTHEDLTTTITAYDALYNIANFDATSWYQGLTFPMTLKAFRDSFFNNLGIYQVSRTLTNDSLQITKTIDPDEISGLEIVEAICQANCVYGKMSREGKFDYIDLTASSSESIAKSEYQTTEYENFTTAKIDKVVIREDEADIGAIAGSGTNALVIEGNFLLYGQGSTALSQIANTLLNKVNGIAYNPSTLTCIGMPWLETGDAVTYSTAKNTVSTFILERELSGEAVLTDKYTADGTEYRDSKINSVNSSIVQLQGKANRLTRTVEETNSKIDDVEEGLNTTITQTKDEIELQINDIYSQIDGSISVYYTNETPTLLNYPAWDFTYNIPCNDTVQTTDNLCFLYNDEYYRKNLRAIDYDMTASLTYRFRTDDSGTWHWEEIADTEYGVLMQKVTSLEISDGEIKTSVTELYGDVDDLNTTTATMSSSITQTATEISAEVTRATNAEGTLSTKITQNATSITSEVTRATNAESTLSTKITQTESSISAEVTRATNAEGTLSTAISINADAITSKVSKGNISSEISQESGLITISSDRLVINSSHFSLAADGTMSCTGATISGYTTTSELSAVSGAISDLKSIAITTNNLSSQSIDAGQITTGTISTDRLSSKVLTSDSISAFKLDASQITSGTISADRIDADTFKSKGMSCYSLTASHGVTTSGLNFNDHACRWVKIGSYYVIAQQ